MNNDNEPPLAMAAHECRICGTPREARVADLYCAGPADLCDEHYNRWFRLYEQQGGISNPDAYSRALELLGQENAEPAVC